MVHTVRPRHGAEPDGTDADAALDLDDALDTYGTTNPYDRAEPVNRHARANSHDWTAQSYDWPDTDGRPDAGDRGDGDPW